MIRKISILSASFALIACGGSDSSSVTINEVIPSDGVSPSRIAFNPGAGVLPLPSDLLFSGTTDGTLEPPDEADAKEAGEPVDLSNPGAAIGGGDGWSTQLPLQISVDMADGATLNASSVGPETVVMLQTNCGLGLTGCSSFTPLTYGVDYVAVSGSDTITVAPIVPLTPKTNYLVALTNGILDSRGEALAPSTFYEGVTVDSAVVDIQNETLSALQDAINGYEGIAFAGSGVNPDDMIFTASWTTGSAGDAVIATASAVTTAYTPTVVDILPHPAIPSTPGGTADVYLGSITLPYFLAVSTAEAPGAALTERFEAICDNGVLLSQVDPAVLASLSPGENAATCSFLGLGDFGLDTERYVTRYNPVAKVQSDQALDVILTVPNGTSGSTGPFPIVMYQHGVTTNKETVLAFADSMAIAGYATIAIDLPLHGSRGFDLDGDDVDEINASLDPTNYINLAYLQTGKDNFRQSVLDMIGLRMAARSEFLFNAASVISDADFDHSSVKFVGMSLGGMTGTSFIAASAALMMPIESSALIVPGGGIVPLLMDSGSFGALIQGTVLTGAGLDPATVDPATAAAVLGQFTFAAQTVIESVDPNNFASSASLASDIFLVQVNGDATIPNQSSFGGLTFGGTEPLAALFGLDQLSFGDPAADTGFVKFTEGGHGTFLSPEISATATAEMQSQVATFISGGGVEVTDAGVVE